MLQSPFKLDNEGVTPLLNFVTGSHFNPSVMGKNALPLTVLEDKWGFTAIESRIAYEKSINYLNFSKTPSICARHATQ